MKPMKLMNQNPVIFKPRRVPVFPNRALTHKMEAFDIILSYRKECSLSKALHK